MAELIIEGRRRLRGSIEVQGAKNSALPILAATVLCGDSCVIHNCPNLTDVDVSCRILRYLGCSVQRQDTTLLIDTKNMSSCDIPQDLMREMRSSIVFLGAIISRTGSCTLSFPGGCKIGPRPIDLHLSSLAKMGVEITEDHGTLECVASQGDGLHGASIALSFPSVGATENIMLAAVCAKGTTTVSNVAREPEICDLADFLNSCGAHISGAGESTMYIDGVEKLHGTQHSIIPDRIAAATYIAATAVTSGSSIFLHHVLPCHLTGVLPVFEQSGCTFDISPDGISVDSPHKLNGVKLVRTMPYPGFPTDAQPPVMGMCTVANGTSVFVENIFESRYKHVDELVRLGAKISVQGKVAVVEGVKRLSGAAVQAEDLRGGASLLVAALAAEGTTHIKGLSYIERGYEDIDVCLSNVGAYVKKV